VVRARRPRPRSPFCSTSSRARGAAGQVTHTSRWSGRAARAALVDGLSSSIGIRRTAVTPVVIDQCQQPTILLSRRAPIVPAHSASCSLTSRWLALHGASASLGGRDRDTREHCPLPQRLRAYRGCFVTRGFPGRTRLARPPAPPRPRTKCGDTGQPPDGRGLRPRVA
jgi:hypothetical protein